MIEFTEFKKQYKALYNRFVSNDKKNKTMYQ